jgi:hypothetical protein
MVRGARAMLDDKHNRYDRRGRRCSKGWCTMQEIYPNVAVGLLSWDRRRCNRHPSGHWAALLRWWRGTRAVGMRTKMYWCGHWMLSEETRPRCLTMNITKGALLHKKHGKYPRVDISLAGGSTMVLIGVNRAIEPTGRVAEVVRRNESRG